MKIRILPVVLAALSCITAGAGCEKRGQGLRLGGGPSGGTFVVAAQAVAEILQEDITGLRVIVERSGGSLANLQGIEEKELDMALVYGADLYLAATPSDGGSRLPSLQHTRILARLYPAAAQLVVLDDSRIRLPSQLRGARVGIGSPGSGASLAAERYFRALGIWDQLTPVYIGYEAAMAELMRGNLSAVWEIVGVPSPSVTQASSKIPLRLLNLRSLAEHGNFFISNPFYQPMDIAPHTYPGQDKAVETFSDSAFLVVSDTFPAADAARVLQVILSEKGIERLRAAHPALSTFSAGEAHKQVPAPLHEGVNELQNFVAPPQVSPQSQSQSR
jgi:TRAP transporter TAXI family solute receptor